MLSRFLWRRRCLVTGLPGIWFLLGIVRRAISIDHGDSTRELLVVCVAHHHLYVHGAPLEFELVVGVHVSREPVLAVYVLTVGFKVRVLVVAIAGHALAGRFDDLQVLVVHPDSTLKVPLPLRDLTRLYIKDVGLELINAFFTYVVDLVFWNVIKGQRKRLNTCQIVHIFLGHGYLGQSRLRKE